MFCFFVPGDRHTYLQIHTHIDSQETQSEKCIIEQQLSYWPSALCVGKCELTCAFFDAGAFFHCVPTELALEVILPELCKPDIPPVVL